MSRLRLPCRRDLWTRKPFFSFEFLERRSVRIKNHGRHADAFRKVGLALIVQDANASCFVLFAHLYQTAPAHEHAKECVSRLWMARASQLSAMLFLHARCISSLYMMSSGTNTYEW